MSRFGLADFYLTLSIFGGFFRFFFWVADGVFQAPDPRRNSRLFSTADFCTRGTHVLRFRLNIWFDDEHHPVQWFLTRCREFTALLLAKVSVFLRTADLVLAFMHRIQLFSRIADPADSTW